MDKNPVAAKVALITGSARRIGAEIARLLHTAGMNIVIHYRSSAKEAEALATALNSQRANSAMTLAADLEDMKSLEPLIQKAVAAWGRLDVLVNNASCFYRTPVGEVSEAAWDNLMNCNLKSIFFLSQAAFPFLRAQKGAIINITDIHATRPFKEYSVYCISKSGLLMLTQVLAREMGPDVRVNAVAPGSILWPEGENSLSAADQQKLIKRTALLRSGAADDIAKAVLYFVRDADYVTGQNLAVDGGRLLFD